MGCFFSLLPFFFITFAVIMNETKQKRTFKDWIIAMRPWSFTASIMPILILWGLLFYGQTCGNFSVNWHIAFLCLPMLLLMHAGGNMVSDYFDYKHKVDLPGGPNGVTWIFNGKFKAKTILYYGIIVEILGACLGIVILLNASWNPIWIGIIGMLFAFCYFWFKGHWLGDFDILCSFALLPAIGTMYVATGQYHPETLLFILPLGLLTVSILHANNTRDLHSDHNAGLETLSYSMGGRIGKRVYLFETIAPYILTLIYCTFCHQPWTLMIVILTLPIAIRNEKTMLAADDNMVGQIPTLDKNSAQLQMLFGLLYAIGYFIGAAL